MYLNSHPIKYGRTNGANKEHKKKVMVYLSWHDKLITLIIKAKLTWNIPTKRCIL